MKNSDVIKLKIKVIRGMSTLILREIGLKVIAIFGQLILVRLIAPEYFGIFAIILFVVALFENFTDLGLLQAIVRQKNKLNSVQLSSIFFLRLVLSLGVVLLLILLSPLIMHIYRQLKIEDIFILIILSLTLITKSFKNILISLFDRELNFRPVFMIDTIGIFVYYFVAISLALQRLFIWNFVFAILIREIVELLISMRYNSWRPRFIFSLKSIRPMINFGFYLQIGNLVSLLEGSLVQIVGVGLNPSSVGLLYWADSVARLSNTLFDNYSRAAYSGMSKIQHIKNQLSSSINKSISLLNLFSFLFTILVVGFGFEFIHTFLTMQWIPAYPALVFFVSSTMFVGGAVSIAHALLAIGKSKIALVISGVNVCLEYLIALYFIKIFGFTGIAVASFIASVTVLMSYILAGHKYGLVIEFKKTFIDKFIVFVLTYLSVILMNMIIPNYLVITLIAKVILTIAIYTFLVYFICPYDIKEIKAGIAHIRPKK